MAVCTFFGHRDCPEEIRPKLREALVRFIEDHGVDQFYVGNQGTFDRIAREVLCRLKKEYPHIRYAVVLAYMPAKRGKSDASDLSDTLLPEGIETVPERFAISWRNRWMLYQSDFVLAYITHEWGGAAPFASLAVRQGKTVANLGERSG